MASILEWEINQPNYLSISQPIDVKSDEETLEIIVERIKKALEQEKEYPYVTANQVGYNYQVYGLRVGDGVEIWANPLMARGEDRMILVADKEFGLENPYYIPRWPKISVIAYSVDKKLVCTRDYEAEAACILQHVMNNLNGISLADVGLEITQDFRDASENEKREVVEYYVSELERMLTVLENDIAGDSELNQKYAAFKFVKARAEKEIESERPIKKNRKLRRLLDRMFKKKGSKK